MSTAVSEASLEIPLIDFSAFLAGDAATKKTTAQAILAGFQTAGFIYLSKHGVPHDMLERTFEESAKFFARPRVEKDAVAWTTPEVFHNHTSRTYTGLTNLERQIEATVSQVARRSPMQKLPRRSRKSVHRKAQTSRRASRLAKKASQACQIHGQRMPQGRNSETR